MSDPRGPKLLRSVGQRLGPRAPVSLTALILLGLFLGAACPLSARPASGHRGSRTTPGAAVRWNSGVYPGDGIDLAAASAFARFRGRRLDNVHVFPEASSWDELAHDWWEVRQYAGFSRRLVIDVPLLPISGGSTLSDVAAGRDDRYFRSMAKTLVAHGRGDSVLVVGSEFNGNWQSYSAFDPPAFVAAFRRVARLFKSMSPDFQIDWTGNAIDNQAGHDPFTADYPGDHVVDIVGVDAYDDPGSEDQGFGHWLNQPFGLADWARFARDHGKPFSVPEWGLRATHGDDPEFVRGMFAFFHANQSNLAFEDYFNEPTHVTRNSLTAPVEMPEASRVYRELWSGLGPDPAAGSLRLRASGPGLARRRWTRLVGRLRLPGASVRHRTILLYGARPKSSVWTAVGRRLTDRRGRVSFRVRPRATTNYRAQLGRSGTRYAVSGSLLVRVMR